MREEAQKSEGPQARADILADHLKGLPEELLPVDVSRLISATEGFTGADLKRLVEDGKAIYVYDKARGAQMLPTADYFMRAVEAVKENKQHYAAAEAQNFLQPKSPMTGFLRSFVSSQA